MTNRQKMKKLGRGQILFHSKVGRHHWMLVCGMTLEIKKRKHVQTETMIKC